MRPSKVGQVTKFHTPLPEENPDQLYVVLELMMDVEKPRAQIRALNTGLSLPPVNTVLIEDLKVVEVDTSDLLGHSVTINKEDATQVKGRVIRVKEKKILLDLNKGVNGVETNVWLTVKDADGMEHSGSLFI